MPFTKGQSGNPGGRPKDTLGAFLRSKKKLPQELFDAVHPLLKSDDESTRMKAAEFLRDTRDGKPSQMFDIPSDTLRMIIVRSEDNGK